MKDVESNRVVRLQHLAILPILSMVISLIFDLAVGTFTAEKMLERVGGAAILFLAFFIVASIITNYRKSKR